jgi:transposase
MLKVPNQQYTPEFRAVALKRVKDGQSIRAVARELGMSGQTLRTWIKAAEGRWCTYGLQDAAPPQWPLMQRFAHGGRISGVRRPACG